MEHNDNLLIMLLRIDFSWAQAELEALAKKVLDDDDEEQVLLP